MTDDLRPMTLTLKIDLSASAQLVIKRMTGSVNRTEQTAYLRRAMTRELMHDAVGWGGWEPVIGCCLLDPAQAATTKETTMPEAHDLLLDYEGDPAALDRTLTSMPIPCALVGAPDFVKHDGHYVARVFGDPSAFKFFVENQGYCRVIRELDELL